MLYIILFIIIIALLLALSSVWPPDSPWAPWWKVKKGTAKKICQELKITEKETVYELGSGDGEFILTAAKEFGAKAVGIEIDPLRFYISLVRVIKNGLDKKVTLYRKNFFDVNVSPATIVFLYLVPKALTRLMPKLLKELKPGTKIVSFRYIIPEKSLTRKIKKVSHNKKLEIYVYTINNT